MPSKYGEKRFDGKCNVVGCTHDRDGRFPICNMHRLRLRRKGVKLANISMKERIFSRIVLDEFGCWNYCGSKSRGYGTARVEGKPVRIHRFIYEFYYGKIPDNLNLCHKCDNKACVNPSHMFIGTQWDNMQDLRFKKIALSESWLKDRQRVNFITQPPE